MRHLKENEFAERRKTASEARAKLLAKVRDALHADDPVRAAARTERAAAAAERQQRRTRAKSEAETADLVAVAAAAKASEVTADQETARRAEADLEVARRQAARDLRYASRKARQR